MINIKVLYHLKIYLEKILGFLGDEKLGWFMGLNDILIKEQIDVFLDYNDDKNIVLMN